MADGKLVIVTGAAENHARPLLNLLFSLDHYEPDTPVFVYDLGLSEETLAILRRQRHAIVPFRFADYPPHVGADRLRTYAWKPAMVHEVLQREGAPLLYLDAGNLVHKRLHRVRAELAQPGFYSPLGTGVIVNWCHPTTLETMQVEPDIHHDRNRNAAIIGFGTSQMAREIAESWYEWAMRPEVICPPGATKKDGHRFDQTILSVLVARARRRHGFTPADALLDVSYHNDRLSLEEARRYMKCKPPQAGADSAPRELALRHWRQVRRLRRRAKQLARRLRRAAKRILRRIKTAIARG